MLEISVSGVVHVNHFGIIGNSFRAFPLVKGKWQQKFLLSHLKETLKVIYKRLLQNFYI